MLVALMTACKAPQPPENLEPFVSERLLGEWSGFWALPAMFQTGTADMSVSLEDETIRFLFTIDGGIVSPEDEEPVIVDLTGADGAESVTLTGEADKIGYVEFTIDENGLITGMGAEPRDDFRDRMFDLDAWIDLDEIERAAVSVL